ncbi:MAG TPA: AI-2E family transporter [Caulobacteraceae bacterium]|nr:AI-2E family transporter [Caulobacteraceae bacterium]
MADTQTGAMPASTRIAIIILAVIAVGASLHWLRSILTPLALALFLTLMIDSFARVLRRRLRFPPLAAMPLALVISVVLIGAAAMVVASNAAGFLGELYGYAPKMDGIVVSIGRSIGVAVPPTIGQLIQQLNPTAYLGPVASAVENFAAAGFLVLIYLGFLLASRAGFEKKLASLYANPGERHRAALVFLRIRNGVEGYLWVQTVACGIIALGSWGVMAAVGLDNAVFWAFLIFIIGYIPIIGGMIGSIAPPLFALVQFDNWLRALVLFIGLQIIGFVVGSILYPRMQGRSLNIDPVVVLLALAFWGVVWGIPGMILSTPLTVVMMAVLAQFPGTRWIAVMLSADGDPLGEAKLAAQIKARVQARIATNA